LLVPESRRAEKSPRDRSYIRAGSTLGSRAGVVVNAMAILVRDWKVEA
jgi:hypothetical protein